MAICGRKHGREIRFGYGMREGGVQGRYMNGPVVKNEILKLRLADFVQETNSVSYSPILFYLNLDIGPGLLFANSTSGFKKSVTSSHEIGFMVVFYYIYKQGVPVLSCRKTG